MNGLVRRYIYHHPPANNNCDDSLSTLTFRDLLAAIKHADIITDRVVRITGCGNIESCAYPIFTECEYLFVDNNNLKFLYRWLYKWRFPKLKKIYFNSDAWFMYPIDTRFDRSAWRIVSRYAENFPPNYRCITESYYWKALKWYSEYNFKN